MSNTILEKALQFGQSLDQDNFENALILLDENCEYDMGESTLKGAKAIIKTYEDNMKEGHQKFDELIWGNCEVELLNENQAIVYFSDFLKHKGIEHNYKCSQILTFNASEKIIKIEHRELEGERTHLDNFLIAVGLKKD